MSDGPVDDSFYDFFHNVIKPLEDKTLWNLLRQAVYENYYECEEELSKLLDEGKDIDGADSGTQSSSSSTHSREYYGTESKSTQNAGRKSFGNKKRSRELKLENSAQESWPASYTCDLCGENIVHKYNLSRHFQVVHRENNWCFCGEDGCIERFESKEKLQQHKIEAHTLCKNCDRRFDSFLGLRIHQSERWQCGVKARKSSHENDDFVDEILAKLAESDTEDTKHGFVQVPWSVVVSSEKEICLESWTATLIVAFAHIFCYGIESMTIARMDNIIKNGQLLHKCQAATGLTGKAERGYRLICDSDTPVSVIVSHGQIQNYSLISMKLLTMLSSGRNANNCGLIQVGYECVGGLFHSNGDLYAFCKYPLREHNGPTCDPKKAAVLKFPQDHTITSL